MSILEGFRYEKTVASFGYMYSFFVFFIYLFFFLGGHLKILSPVLALLSFLLLICSVFTLFRKDRKFTTEK